MDKMGSIVYNGIADGTAIHGDLFQGQKFFFSQRVPSRKHFVEQVEANGGQVVPGEKNADIRIVDHMRKNNPPGTHSYTFVDRSLHNGRLENLDDHIAGPPAGTIRTVGSSVQPAKGTRRPFSPEDDQVLFKWVVDSERKGGKIYGIKIYQELEKQNSRHTTQAWRSRWVDHLSKMPRPAQESENDLSTSPSDRSPRNDNLQKTRIARPFTDEDAAALLNVADDLEAVPPSQVDKAWEAWAKSWPDHSAFDWKAFWEADVRPIHLEKQNSGHVKEEHDPGTPDSVPDPNIDTTRQTALVRAETSPTSVQRSPSVQSASRVPVSHRQALREIATGVEFNQFNASIAQLDKSAKASNRLHSRELTPANVKLEKRKRDTIEDETSQNSSIDVSTSSPNKRYRSDARTKVEPEIPSTPESSPSRESSRAVDAATYIVDLQYETELKEGRSSGTDDEEEEEEEVIEYSGLPASQSLSEPDQSAPDVQEQLEGLEELADSDVLSEHDRDDLEEVAETNEAQPKDTQALLSEEPQAVDFLLPAPDGDWAKGTSFSFALGPSASLEEVIRKDHGTDSPGGIDEEEDLNAQMDAWIDAHISRGISPEAIEKALKSASMDIVVADTVLGELAETGVIPSGVRDVWTEEDDGVLQGPDARKIESLRRKLGEDECDRRLEFLDKYHAVGMELT